MYACVCVCVYVCGWVGGALVSVRASQQIESGRGTATNKEWQGYSLHFLQKGYSIRTTKVPDGVGQWCPGLHCSLEKVALAENMLSGALPDAVGSWTSVKQFTVLGNWMAGALPGAIASWTSMKGIDLRKNTLSGIVLDLEMHLPVFCCHFCNSTPPPRPEPDTSVWQLCFGIRGAFHMQRGKNQFVARSLGCMWGVGGRKDAKERFMCVCMYIYIYML